MKRIIYTIILLLHCLLVIGQDSKISSSKTDVDFYMEANSKKDSILINWIPTSFDLWKEYQGKSFVLQREELKFDFDIEPFLTSDIVKSKINLEELLGANYSNLSKEIIIEKLISKFEPKDVTSGKIDISYIGSKDFNIQVKGQEWYDKTALDNDGFNTYMGQLLFNPDFKKINKNKNHELNLYHYANFATAFYPDVANALGFSYMDKDIEIGKYYRYTLSTTDGEIITQITLPNKPGGMAFNSNNFWYDYGDVKFGINETSPGDFDFIASKARSYNDSITIRWFQSSHIVWKKTLTSGYLIKKYEVVAINDSTENKIFIDSIKIAAWDSLQFSKYKDTNDDMLKVAAMAMYGDNTTGGSYKQQSNGLKNQYSYAVFAGMRSQTAANALGLRYVDNKVEKGKTYIYEINLLSPPFEYLETQVRIKNEYLPLETPQGLAIISGEYEIQLTLPKRENKDKFVFYNIERSDNQGQTFISLNKEPIMFSDNQEQGMLYTYRDSVEENYKKYIYRINGMNEFGESSEWVEIEGQAVDLTPPPPPVINTPIQTSPDVVEITWQDIDAPDDFEGYFVTMGGVDVNTRKQISSILPLGTTKFIHTDDFNTQSSYYFQVVARDRNGNVAMSVPVFLNVVDSIAPAIPSEIVASIDSAGIVKLAWEHSPDTDLKGYKVYFANNPNDEFSQLSNGLITYNYFQDTLALNVMNEAVYYKVQAQDLRYNASGLSEPIIVKRPDIIPPTTPVLEQPLSTEEGLKITWRPSTSTDVVAHLLYKKEQDSTTWIVLDSLINEENVYLDTQVDYEKVYTYSIRAIDDAGLYSEYAMSLKGRRSFSESIGGVNNITSSFNKENQNITLNWSFIPPTEKPLSGLDYRFVIYRGAEDGPMKRLIQMKSKTPTYIDKEIEGEQTYQYTVIVVYQNGKKSGMDKSVSVIIPKLNKEDSDK